ncbi:hypothetical protein SNOG_09361 [Parastagonospora nodorum SN15]|uniref:DUF2423 domain-containing protein n=1 Tax=Phaeosphaeria nodorum (strain SN15 / ATCC MYA-4574 / FGSC 10173) TaxID=321614 RepID=Q0UFV3_PHANO|nr:hypothetical protein SNOG_09361 [Parastagonospora nodorum SN15]EAT83553.2 hypothetical protein SNOG_09361 [Parastagonospora nodorum SN15]
MAKGARASSKKANRTKLRARVFGPADKARAERIHAKLLETIQQPKPEKTNMDTTEDATAATKEDDFPKGSSFLTAPIPHSLSDSSNTKFDPTRDSCELRNLCFQLGLCSDVLGFTEEGALQVAFDPLPPHWLNMDVDGAAKTSTKKGNKDKSQTRKQLRRKSINKISFPASRGKGALKPFTGGRVKKR